MGSVAVKLDAFMANKKAAAANAEDPVSVCTIGTGTGVQNA